MRAPKPSTWRPKPAALNLEAPNPFEVPKPGNKLRGEAALPVMENAAKDGWEMAILASLVESLRSGSLVISMMLSRCCLFGRLPKLTLPGSTQCSFTNCRSSILQSITNHEVAFDHGRMDLLSFRTSATCGISCVTSLRSACAASGGATSPRILSGLGSWKSKAGHRSFWIA